MVPFEQAVNKLLCGIQDELKKIRQINETWEKRETTDIAFFTLPENGGVRSFAIGTTKIDFKTGVIVNPDNTKEYMNRKLDMISQEWLHSISVDSDQDIKLKILPNSIRSVDAFFSTQIPYLNFNEVEITCTAVTNIKVFACTNPSAVVGQYKNPMTDVSGRLVVSSISQLNVEKDVTEAQTWDASLTSLMSNLNRIRYAVVTMSGEAWGTFSHTIASLWAKFNATTGHAHTGSADDAPKISINSLNEVTISSPGVDQYFKYNGSKWVNSTLNLASAGSGVVYYFTDAASDLATFEVLSKVPDTAAETDESQSVTNTTTEFERYVSPSGGLGGTEIDTGMWVFDLYTYISDAADISELLIDVYSRNVAGTETLLFSLTTGNIDALATTLYQIVSVQPAFSITATDRLVVRVSAKTNSASAKTVHFVHSGTTHCSNITTPLVIRHNELIGLQGGSATERYHLTAAQVAALGGSFFRQFWQKQGTVVQGVWAWFANAAQTDFTSITGEGSGFYYNSSNTNLDEYKWPSIFLSSGTYKITLTYMKSTRGIAEILFGTTSIGTVDQYAVVDALNQTATFTFTVATPTTADFRFRVNGKNASSSAYYVDFSRFQLEKTG